MQALVAKFCVVVGGRGQPEFRLANRETHRPIIDHLMFREKLDFRNLPDQIRFDSQNLECIARNPSASLERSRIALSVHAENSQSGLPALALAKMNLPRRHSAPGA